jgi:hypothetical protein
MYHPERLHTIVSQMQKGGHEFVFSRVQYIGEEDTLVTNSHPVARNYFRYQRNINSKQFPSVGFACLSANVSISTGNLFLRDHFLTVSVSLTIIFIAMTGIFSCVL